MNPEYDAYILLMNILDDIALDKKKYKDYKMQINKLAEEYNFTPQDVGDANDSYGETWEEVIYELKKNFDCGNRI